VVTVRIDPCVRKSPVLLETADDFQKSKPLAHDVVGTIESVLEAKTALGDALENFPKRKAGRRNSSSHSPEVSSQTGSVDRPGKRRARQDRRCLRGLAMSPIPSIISDWNVPPAEFAHGPESAVY
jgi:hypothetical protein